jgi:hypothetical protein
MGPSLARRASVNVRFGPESDRLPHCREMTLWANRIVLALQQFRLSGQLLARRSLEQLESLSRFKNAVVVTFVPPTAQDVRVGRAATASARARR